MVQVPYPKVQCLLFLIAWDGDSLVCFPGPSLRSAFHLGFSTQLPQSSTDHTHCIMPAPLSYLCYTFLSPACWQEGLPAISQYPSDLLSFQLDMWLPGVNNACRVSLAARYGWNVISSASGLNKKWCVFLCPFLIYWLECGACAAILDPEVKAVRWRLQQSTANSQAELLTSIQTLFLSERMNLRLVNHCVCFFVTHCLIYSWETRSSSWVCAHPVKERKAWGPRCAGCPERVGMGILNENTSSFHGVNVLMKVNFNLPIWCQLAHKIPEKYNGRLSCAGTSWLQHTTGEGLEWQWHVMRLVTYQPLYEALFIHLLL